MRIKILPREKATPRFTLAVLALSLLAGLVAVGMVFLTKGVNPFYAIAKIFTASFGSWFGITETITKAIPLVLIGAGLAVAYQAKFWNIGAESQLLFGAIFATWVGLNWAPYLPRPVAIFAMLLAGFVGGALWGVIPALLKVKFGINEVITTLMMNYMANEFVKFLVVGPWKGASKGGYPYTDDIADSAVFNLMGYSRISLLMMILALLVALILCFTVYKSRFGYEIRVIGENPEAARYAGIDFFRTSLFIMIISGGVAGLAGVGEIGAIHHHLSHPATISGGLGFTAIIVAWLGRLNPAFAILSGLFFAGIIVGGDAIQISMNLPAATVNVFNGLILTFLIMGDFFLSHRLQFVRRSS
ncbi:MAG: ABC transporter permease [Spirochaetales bacterium]|nr:ABC transporter permease [Spirochaetales bacterium]